MKITLISPYHGGSHRSWAEGWQQSSRHNVSALTLPDRFWKWRMHGAALTLARRFTETGAAPDLLVATDMLDLSTFLALTRSVTAGIPAALYMHENQLTYPLPSDGRTGPMRRQLGERDHHYAFINLASMLAADHIFFNSHFHLSSWFAALPNFLKHFPEYNEMGAVTTLLARSSVLPVGVDLQRLQPAPDAVIPRTKTPLILWNQRWEFDKNPEQFFAAIFQLAESGVPFQLALCGQQYGQRPSIFNEALERLGDHIIHVGFAEPDHYRALLWQADIILSTALHEFFGISIVEAICCNTFPILPDRLSYPELLPEAFHQRCLYENQAGLQERLQWAIRNPKAAQDSAADIANSLQRFDWRRIGPIYDEQLAQIAYPK